MRKPIFAILAACAAIVAALAIPAVAPAATFRTSVSINFVDRAGPDIFRGRVGSPNAACISDRTVRLYRVRPARDQLIDTDKSENNGSWSIRRRGRPRTGRLLRPHPAKRARRQRLLGRDVRNDRGRRLGAPGPGCTPSVD